MKPVRPRLLACLFALLATACGGGPPGMSATPSPSAPLTPGPSASPSPGAYITAGRLPAVGPEAYFPCPGEMPLARRMASREDVREVARRLLQAAGAPEPDPRTVWRLLDPSLRALFPSFQAFARKVRSTPYDPTSDPDAKAGVEITGIWPPGEYRGRIVDFRGDLSERCGAQTVARVLRSYRMVQVGYPALQPCAACYAELYVLTHPEGLRFWALYP